jgi:hypothetical protein
MPNLFTVKKNERSAEVEYVSDKEYDDVKSFGGDGGFDGFGGDEVFLEGYAPIFLL